MWKRVRDSIVNPRQVVDYRKDNMFLVILYLMFFVLLLSTTTIIGIVQFDGFDSNIRDYYKKSMVSVDDNCVVTKEGATCDTNKNHLVLDDTILNIYIDTRDDLVMQDYENMYNFVINGDKMYFVFGSQVVQEFLLSDFLSSDIDFNLQSTDSDAFYAAIFDTVDDVANEYKWFWGPVMIVTEMLSNTFMFLMFILLSAWFLRMRFKVVPMKQLFKITVYSSTTLYIIMAFNNLFNMSFFIVFILILIAVRQNSQVSLEIMKRLQEKKS